MVSYIGVKCPVCNKKFTQADDIVVCPVCGAPHHRDCYAQNTACAFAADHISGREWRPPPPDNQYHPPGAETGSVYNGGQNARDVVYCPRCQSQNPKTASFCQTCGAQMGEAQNNSQYAYGQGNLFGMGMGNVPGLDPVSLMYGGLSPDDKIDGESVRDLAVYIGENSAYYLPRFKSMDENEHAMSFNFAALFLNFFYFFYRKMYLVGGVLLALHAVSFIPNFLQLRELFPQMLYNMHLGPAVTVNQALVDHYQNIINIASTINFIICAVLSLCANRLYFLKATTNVKKIEALQPDPRDERVFNQALAAKGGTNKAVVIAVAAGIAVAYIATSTFLLYLTTGGLGL